MTDGHIFELPESVFEYITIPEIESGVDSILAFGTKKVPDGLEWPDMRQFYRATVAAQTVQADWALAHEELWRAVWPDEIDGWAPRRPDEQSARGSDASVSIENCWSEEWYGRCFSGQRSSTTHIPKRRPVNPDDLCLAVSISARGISIGISIEGAGEPEADVPGFHYDEEAGSWWTSEMKITKRKIDLMPARLAAQAALTWAAISLL